MNTTNTAYRLAIQNRQHPKWPRCRDPWVVVTLNGREVAAAKCLDRKQAKAFLDWLDSSIVKDTINNLIDKVKAETVELKARYLALAAERARERVAEYLPEGKPLGEADIQARDKWIKPVQSDWRPRLVAVGKYGEVEKIAGGREHYSLTSKGRKILDLSWIIYRTGADAYVAQAVASAERDYNATTEKFAYTAIGAGANADTCTVRSAKIDADLDVIVSDGDVNIHGRAIVAAGPIIAPHYRYIVTVRNAHKGA